MTDPSITTPPAATAPTLTPVPTPARVRKGWDIALTIVFLALDLGFVLVASLIELLSFAFFDVCPTSGCNSVQDAASVIFTPQW